jgi:AcrR family transcriptional regulator
MSDQREKILVQACALFLKDGLEGFSMRKLARAVGVTAPALYRHFESKERLLHDVLGEAYRRMSRRLYQALEGATPWERLRLAGEGYVLFALEHPRLYDALFASPELVGIADIPEEIEAQGCAVGRFWNDRIRECMDAGMLHPGDPEGVGLTMWAHAHGLIALHSRGLLIPGIESDTEDFLRIYRASMERMLRGLGAVRPEVALETDEKIGVAGTAA